MRIRKKKKRSLYIIKTEGKGWKTTEIKRKKVQIGNVCIGGGERIAIQSMTNTKTEDVEACVAQILKLEKAGCDIIRVAVPTMEAAESIRKIKEQIHIPLVADIHFDYRLAIAAIENGQIRSVSILGISGMKKESVQW